METHVTGQGWGTHRIVDVGCWWAAKAPKRGGRMPIRVLMAAFVCLGFAAPAEAGTTWIGAQLHFPLPSRDSRVQIGATALKDARMPEERGLTMPEWKDKVVATGSAVGAKVTSVFKRTPSRPPVPDDGAQAPDEVQGADGKVVAQPSRSPASAKRKRKGAHAKGRRGKKRAEATLWDSAKESFKQTVKETVAEEVKETPVGSALETLRAVGARVKEGATKVGAGAAKAVNRAIEGNPEDEREELDENGIPIPRPVLVPKPAGPSLQERIDKAGAAIEKAVKGLAEGAARTTSSSASDSSSSSSTAIEPPAPLTEEEAAAAEEAERKAAADRVDVEAGAKAAAQVASEVAGNIGRKMKGGLSAVGSWLQGPGSPDFSKRRRANASGEVVEAKEATVEMPSSSEAPSSTEAPPTPPTGVPAPAADVEHVAQDFDDASDASDEVDN